MTGGCERDADGSARLMADAVRLFAEHRAGKTESCPIRRGISSTDKDVTDSHPAHGMTGGFSSSSTQAREAVLDLARPLANGCPSTARTTSLVDGRCSQGLDSGLVSVKLPVGRQAVRAAHEAASIYGSSNVFRSERFAAPFGRCRDGDLAIVFRIKEVLPPVRQQSDWTEGVGLAATRRTQQGIRRERPAL